METSPFADKSREPEISELHKILGTSLALWEELRAYTLTCYPAGMEEWNFPGIKYGWSFRIKDKKRAIIYFLPREGYFLVAFVFGDKAVAEIQHSGIAPELISELLAARKYAEGRGIRIPVKEPSILEDIRVLIDIKINH